MSHDFSALLELLAACTVRLTVNEGSLSGTGFFVAPGKVLTCSHVVTGSQGEILAPVEATWRQSHQTYTFRAGPMSVQVAADLDLALLHFEEQLPSHPCVAIDGSVLLKDELYAWGYPGLSPNGESATFESEGEAREAGRTLVKQKRGEADSGMSGSPLLNLRTSGVCGVIKASRELDSDMGAFSIPIQLALNKWPEILDLQKQFHDSDERWSTFLPVPRWFKKERASREVAFRTELQQRPEVVESPLAKNWNRFLSQEAWHELVLTQLKQIHAATEGLQDIFALPDPFRKINVADNYETILADLRKVVTDQLIFKIQDLRSEIERSHILQVPSQTQQKQLRLLGVVRHGLLNLKEQFAAPRFNKCFLVMGISGAGKTHFVNSLLSQNPAHINKPLLLPLERTQLDAASFETVLLRTIGEWTGREWAGLDEFDQFLKTRAAHQNRMIVVIDDLHKLIRMKASFLGELCSLIRNSTQFHTLSWVLVLDHNAYDRILDENRFWNDYGFVEGEPQMPLPNAGGWIVLDAFNESLQTGVNIIRTVLKSEEGHEKSVDYLLQQNRNAVRQLSHPFVAWTFLDVRNQLNVKDIGDLNFIEFVTRFWKSWIDRQSSDRHMQSLVDQCAQLIASHFVRSSQFNTSKAALRTAVVALAPAESELRDSKETAAAMDVLESGGLLKRVYSHDDSGGTLEHYEVAFDVVWEWRLAKQLAKEETLLKHQVQEFQKFLSKWMDTNKDGNVATDGVLGFFLLIIDRWTVRGAKDCRLVEDIWRWTLKPGRSRSGVAWLVGPRASLFVQKALASWTRGGGMIDSAARRELFGFLYFIIEAAPEVLTIPERFEQLRPFYKDLRDNALADYFVYAATRALRSVTDSNSLLASMIHLNGCEVLGVASALAESAIDVLGDLEGPPSGTLQSISDFLNRSFKNGEPAERRTGLWERYYFHEWTLFFYSEALVDERGLEAYLILANAGWYRGDRGTFSSPVQISMKREANLALGHWYRTKATHTEQRAYIDLVTSLVNTGNREECEAAFFLIRHTEITGRKKGVSVDSGFRPLLERLYTDSRLMRLRKNYSEFFLKNLRTPHL